MDYITENHKNRHLIDLMIQRKFKLLRHGIFLSTFLIILFFTLQQSPEYQGGDMYYNMVAVFLIFISMFYFNMYLLTPLFFFRGRYISYLFLLLVIVFLGIHLLNFISETYFLSSSLQTESQEKLILWNPIWFLIAYSVILLSTMIKLFQRWILERESFLELKDLTLNMELENLKNQISPHFLFNTLRNVNVLIRKDPDKASVLIHKLSHFLRYQLYENQTEDRTISEEIGFLSNFLNLEKIRRDSFIFTIEAEGQKEMNSIFIPPNLFTTFVENAVKHSADIAGGCCFVHIQFRLKGNMLEFSCKNSIPSDSQDQETRIGGLGLKNIKRRLELLFGKNHRLNISSDSTQFVVHLEIPVPSI